MRLLILTQKVDKVDSVLGFFHEWINEFSKNAESVLVICLEKGTVDLPHNVRVFSLGKEVGASKFVYVFNFYKYIWKYRSEYDSVFVHMNQIYILLGGWLWKVWHKKIALWYVHRQTSLSLWLATRLVDDIFTSSQESFMIKNNKVSYVGHGVDSSKFIDNHFNQDKLTTNIVHVGRITSIKNLETLILAGEILNKKINNLSIEIYGEAINDKDETYKEELEKLVRTKNLEKVILFKGPISNTEISDVYKKANLSVNLTPNGGWDKVVIESLMAYCPVFASNLALKRVFGEEVDKFMFEYKNPEDLAYKIDSFLVSDNGEEVVSKLHDYVVKEYDFKSLIKKLCNKIGQKNG